MISASPQTTCVLLQYHFCKLRNHFCKRVSLICTLQNHFCKRVSLMCTLQNHFCKRMKNKHPGTSGESVETGPPCKPHY